MYTRNKVNLTITTILLVSALIIMLAPFYFIVVNSFKPLSEIAANGFALPKHFSLENYFVAWNRIDFGNALKNTTIILKLPITTHRTKKRLCKSQEKAMQKTRHTSSSVTLTKLSLRLTKTAVSELTVMNISLLRALTNFTMSTQRVPATPFWQDLCMVYSMITVLKKVFSSET